MNDYHNPNDYWRHNDYDPFNDMTDEERMKMGCFQFLGAITAFIIAMLLCMLFGSCTTTKYVNVPVVEKHEVHHHHTDSIYQIDSTYHEKTTIIQQLDSAAMARYGIQLKAAERAWLIKTAELEKQLQQLERLTADRDTVRDSVPVPYAVPEYIQKPLPWWKTALMWIGFAFIIAFLSWILLKIKP